MYWNKQNKHHVKLYNLEEWLYKAGDLEYLNSSLFAKADKINRKLSKMSPRRHKRDAKNLLDRMLKNETIAVNWQEISDIIEQAEEV